MKKLNNFIGLLFIISFLAYQPLLAFAATGSATKPKVQIVVQKKELNTSSTPQQISDAKDRAKKEIDRRIEALNKMITRIESMRRVSDSVKNTLKERAEGQILVLSDLKTKIKNETDVTALKTEIQSITSSYRIFMLILPQIAIDAAADRIKTVADTMTDLSDKLQSRIDIAKAAGKDVSSLQSSLDDMNLNIKNAGANADAAIAEITPLVPDNGDKSIADSNKKTLEDARTKTKNAVKELKTARQDAGTILGALKAFGFQYENRNKNTATTSSSTETKSDE